MGSLPKNKFSRADRISEIKKKKREEKVSVDSGMILGGGGDGVLLRASN